MCRVEGRGVYFRNERVDVQIRAAEGSEPECCFTSKNSQESIFFCNVDVRLRPARTIPFAGPPAALVGRGDAAAALRRCRLDRRDPIVRGGAAASAGRGPAPVAR